MSLKMKSADLVVASLSYPLTINPEIDSCNRSYQIINIFPCLGNYSQKNMGNGIFELLLKLLNLLGACPNSFLWWLLNFLFENAMLHRSFDFELDLLMLITETLRNKKKHI